MRKIDLILRNIAFWRYLILTVVFSIGCVKEEFSVSKLDTSMEFNSALATPLGYFDFRLERVLKISENSNILIRPDKLLSLNYFGEIVSDPAGELFRFDPISEELSIPNPTVSVIDLSTGSYEVNHSLKVPVFLSNAGVAAELDSVTLASGFIRLSGIQFSAISGEAFILIEGLRLNGNSFRLEILPGSGIIMADISGYTLELSREGENTNLIDIDIFVTYPKQNQIIVPSEPLLQFGFDINLREWIKIHGFLGKELINLGQQSFVTDLDRLFPAGDFYFADPTLTLRTNNSFSVPLGVGLTQISSESGQSGRLTLSGSGVPVPPDYFFPSYPDPYNFPMEASDSLIINSKNSNLGEIISSSPNLISYNLEIITNPGKEKVQNTIYSKSRFSTRLELELPFYGSAKSLLLSDTIAVDLSRLNIPSNENIKNVIFNLYYENSFPAEIDLQLYLTDQNLMVTDTLFKPFATIKAALPTDKPVDKPVFVSGQLIAHIPGSRLDNVLMTRYIIGEAIINTNDTNGLVKIFDTQGLKMNLGVIFDINTRIEDF